MGSTELGEPCKRAHVAVEEGIEITATIEKVIVTADEEGEGVSYEIGNIRMGG